MHFVDFKLILLNIVWISENTYILDFRYLDSILAGFHFAKLMILSH